VTPAVRALLLAAALAGGASAASCAAAPPPVKLTEAWPAQAGDYDDVNQAWTRSAKMRGPYQLALEVHATFHSPEWHAAHAGREASIRKLDGAARDALFAAARAAAGGDYEVALVVTTYDRAENNLHRGDRAVWKLALVDDAGVEITPAKVVRDRRPLEILRAELPELGDFAEVYVARFPRTSAVLRDGAQQVTLKLWSVKGSVSMIWSAR
jgi:hypothetical protein